MRDHQRLELYKELYFSEERAREVIQSRLQFVLALIFPVAAAAGYLFDKSGVITQQPNAWIGLQFVFAAFAIVATLSLYYFFRATWGHSYQVIPYASAIETYRSEIWGTYGDYDEQEELTDYYFNAFLRNSFAEAASFNTRVNECRAELIHKCVTWLVIAIIPLFFALFAYLSADFDLNGNVNRDRTWPAESEVRYEREKAPATSSSAAAAAEVHQEGRAAEAPTTSSTEKEIGALDRGE